jgi:acyl-CoA thioesterase I
MTSPLRRRSRRSLAAVALLVPALMVPPLTAEPDIGAADCTLPPGFSYFIRPLNRVAARVAAGQPVTVVALGSSSTAGAGATGPEASYPSRLAVALENAFPHQPITVLNRGVNGEEVPEMLARLDRSVLAEHPDLVIWQLGTNAVLRDRDGAAEGPLIRQGLDRLRAAGADVILMDPQFAPRVISRPHVGRMVDLISSAAREKRVDLFPRFDIMRHWSDVEHVPFEAFMAPDGLHMNDWGYDCVARLLATAIAQSVASAPRSLAGRK